MECMPDPDNPVFPAQAYHQERGVSSESALAIDVVHRYLLCSNIATSPTFGRCAFSTSLYPQASNNLSMVHVFTLPTTSHLSFQTFLTSSTHPSLPKSASTARHALLLALKIHNRLPRGEQQDAHLPTVLTALNDYLPYLFAISHGLSGKPNGANTGIGEEIEITLRTEVESEWRATLSATTSPFKNIGPLPQQRQKNGRVRGRGLDFEIAFTLTSLGYVLNGLARRVLLKTLYNARTPAAEQRTAAIQTATRYLLQASAIHTFLESSPSFGSIATATISSGGGNSAVPDLDSATQSALSSLALAEATLLAVLKDDVYVSTCIQTRNPYDRDWMIGAPEIPKVRALLFARLCVRAAEYAEQAAAGFGSVRTEGKRHSAVDNDLIKYTTVLGRIARAKACRFFGVDAELAGKVGEAIAWLRAARGALTSRNGSYLVAGDECTTATGGSSSKGLSGGLSKLKQGWTERRYEMKMDKDAGGKDHHVKKGGLDPGDSAGRDEEVHVIEMLEAKWVKMNNTVSYPLYLPLLNGVVCPLFSYGMSHR